MTKRLLTILIAILFAVTCSFAQRTEPKEEPSDGLKETMAKWRIKAEKKDFEELQKKGEETEKLVDELTESFTEKKKLTSEDTVKLEKLEKLVKKIRNEVGAQNDDEDTDDMPKDLVEAFATLHEKTTNLLKELKKATRHTVSAIAIETSNSLLKIVRFIRLKRG
jgi:membrane-associated HD superfamily phosphohydrolase